jgi:hypothetical protein
MAELSFGGTLMLDTTSSASTLPSASSSSICSLSRIGMICSSILEIADCMGKSPGVSQVSIIGVIFSLFINQEMIIAKKQ